MPGDYVLLFTRDGDVMAFETPAGAASWMESIDVIDGEYAAMFAVDGRAFSIAAGHAGSAVRVAATDVVDPAALNAHLAGARTRDAFVTDPADPAGVARELLAHQWAARWPQRLNWLHKLVHRRRPTP